MLLAIRSIILEPSGGVTIYELGKDAIRIADILGIDLDQVKFIHNDRVYKWEVVEVRHGFLNRIEKENGNKEEKISES